MMREKMQKADVSEGQPRSDQDKTMTTQQARRRLLKTATMAPVIYTLSTGAATAAGSITCTEKPGNLHEHVVRDGDQIRLASQDPSSDAFCELQNEFEGVGELCDGGINGQWYHDDDFRTLTTASCWTSLM